MSTITKEFTKEQLQQIEAAAKEVLWPVVWSEKKARKHFSEKITPEVVLELARIALASLEAEPVGFIVRNKETGQFGSWMHSKADWFKDDGYEVLRAYIAPPAPVVPDFDSWFNSPEAGLRVVNYHIQRELQERAWNACRAAMLKQPSSIQGRDDAVSDSEIKQPSSNVQLFGVTEQLEPASQTYRLRDGLAAIRKLGPIDAEKIQAERDALNEPTCWCLTCRPVTMTDMRFVVCPDCGNKRCPHANDHRHACTGSNEPGQEGSAYPAAPQQEVTQALAKGMERYGDAMQELAQREMK